MNTCLPKSDQKRVMSGMRPTGRLHLGHYVGVLKNWISLQNQYSCYFSIVDWHALTTQYDDTGALRQNIMEVALDWLSAGIDPKQATVYVQSLVPEILELNLLLGMITPKKWVETDPTLKDMVAMLHEDLTYGLLGYPILQAADILSVKGDFVPIGKDQLAHLEIVRDIVTRFNHIYQVALFPSPKPLLTETPLLPGVDARKMGKSYGNAIYLSDSAEETWNKLKKGITDPARIKRTDPGNPENCEVIYKYYKVFASPAMRSLAAEECKAATRGCMDCKRIIADCINEELVPLRSQRTELAKDPEYVHKVLHEGAQQARTICCNTLQEVRLAMKLYNIPT